RCYLNWTITLATEADPERLRDVFLFVSEDSKVEVERRAADGSMEKLPSPLFPEPAGMAIGATATSIPTASMPAEPARPSPLEVAPTTNGHGPAASVAAAPSRA